jgi:hypothetical protein
LFGRLRRNVIPLPSSAARYTSWVVLSPISANVSVGSIAKQPGKTMRRDRRPVRGHPQHGLPVEGHDVAVGERAGHAEDGRAEGTAGERRRRDRQLLELVSVGRDALEGQRSQEGGAGDGAERRAEKVSSHHEEPFDVRVEEDREERLRGRARAEDGDPVRGVRRCPSERGGYPDSSHAAPAFPGPA